MTNYDKIRNLKSLFPKGTRVYLNYKNERYEIPHGLSGTVEMIDDVGQVTVCWDDGRTFSIPYVGGSLIVVSYPDIKDDETIRGEKIWKAPAKSISQMLDGRSFLYAEIYCESKREEYVLEDRIAAIVDLLAGSAEKSCVTVSDQDDRLILSYDGCFIQRCMSRRLEQTLARKLQFHRSCGIGGDKPFYVSRAELEKYRQSYAILQAQKEENDYNVTEQCPHCGEEVAMRWSVEEHGYQAFCPFCGEPLMLCDECRHAGGKSCNYSEGTKSCILGSSTRYPELTGYRDHRLYLPAETTGEEEKWLGCYQIIFEADGERYYCSVDAEDLTEALGRFFMEHPHITYDLVVDHTEAGTSRPPCTNGGSA